MSIIMEQNGKEETLLENAASLEVKENDISISALFEPPRVLENVRVKKIDFLGGKVTVVPAEKEVRP